LKLFQNLERLLRRENRSLVIRRGLDAFDVVHRVVLLPEWQKPLGLRERVEGELFGFAGLWERWKDPSGNWVKSCTILTTTPNAVTAAVHDRMPVILNPDNYDLWLDPGFTDVAAASEMLKPHDADAMRFYPVSSRVSKRTMMQSAQRRWKSARSRSGCSKRILTSDVSRSEQLSNALNWYAGGNPMNVVAP